MALLRKLAKSVILKIMKLIEHGDFRTTSGIFGEATRAGVNLVLVGHTHGGQIGIPFLVRKSNSANKSRFLSGLFENGKTKMYVNRGIGTTHEPVRLFCRPEITVIRVEK